MARFIVKKQNEIGLSPDALFFRGEQKIDNVLLRLIDFDSANLEEKAVDKIRDVLSYGDKDTVTWFNVDGLHNPQVMKEIATGFNIERLVLAEVMDTQSRPKIHEYANCILLSLKMIQLDEATESIEVENLSMIITDSVLITFQEKKGDVFEPVRERIRQQKKRIRSSGTDYLAYALLDIVVDNYIYIISVLGEGVESIEDTLLTNPDKSIIEEINGYKRQLNLLRKSILPAKEMIQSLAKIESDFIKDTTYVHFKELLDHVNQAIEASDSYREILSDQLNIYHTTISSKLNDIMKFLTIFSVIFIPLTFIAGIYGTNFDVVPELHYEYSYFIMLGVMAVMATGMMIYFKRKDWF
ncbi:MAG: magnesium/cobalt transporter CorA [Saprospiraceae bacterium]|nr:magnesium/cobalt transporter CorA [Saprospiraceae bacterium]